jgi:cyclic beta-1,2-glucan synthetase
MLNPINHARSRTAALRYRVEPYVACGDVYSMPPNVGRGGWTWYTGSAAWMYRTAVEYMLGIRVQGDTLVIDPVIPSSWPRFEVSLRHGDATYEIVVENPAHQCKGVIAIMVDNVSMKLDRPAISLEKDAKIRHVLVTLGLPSDSKGGIH